MRPRSRVPLAVATATLVGAAAACNALWGLDELSYGPAGAAGGGGANAGAHGGSTTGGGDQGGATGGGARGGAGGAGGAACPASATTGAEHSCAVDGNHALYCWGANASGQLGDGSSADQHTPAAVASLGSGVATVAAGYDHSCAITLDGSLYCWGANLDGQLGDGTTTSSPTPVAVAGLGATVAQVAAGGSFTCARMLDGSLYCWGENLDGQLGNGTTTSSPTPTQVTALGTSVAAIRIGWKHACARIVDGSLYCWGKNNWGPVGDGTLVDRATPVQVQGLPGQVTQVATGRDHTCARMLDGSLYCWGRNNAGQLGDGTLIDTAAPVQAGSLGTAVAQVAAGWRHSCVRLTDGSLRCWGANGEGQVGDGTLTDRLAPTPVAGLGSGVASISTHAHHSCATTTGGSLYCWGRNDYGQLGDGSVVSKPAPTAVSHDFCP